MWMEVRERKEMKKREMQGIENGVGFSGLGLRDSALTERRARVN